MNLAETVEKLHSKKHLSENDWYVYFTAERGATPIANHIFDWSTSHIFHYDEKLIALNEGLIEFGYVWISLALEHELDFLANCGQRCILLNMQQLSFQVDHLNSDYLTSLFVESE